MEMLNYCFLGLIYFTQSSLCLLPHSRGPTFVEEPPSWLDFSNSLGAVISCTAQGNPLPDIRWLDSLNKPIVYIPGLRELLANGSLYLPAFRSQDFNADIHSASYKCIATNAVGSVLSRECKLRPADVQAKVNELENADTIESNPAYLHDRIHDQDITIPLFHLSEPTERKLDSRRWATIITTEITQSESQSTSNVEPTLKIEERSSLETRDPKKKRCPIKLSSCFGRSKTHGSPTEMNSNKNTGQTSNNERSDSIAHAYVYKTASDLLHRHRQNSGFFHWIGCNGCKLGLRRCFDCKGRG